MARQFSNPFIGVELTNVRIAVQIHPQHGDYQGIRDAVARAEDVGADIVYTWDHFYPLYGDAEGAHFECWTTLAAIAEQTSRIEFGALVTCNSYRNPQLLADMARTVDHISNGRLIFGIGSGWFGRDYEEYGYEFGTKVSRLRDLKRDLPLIRERWSKLNPPPVRPIPIIIGGRGEQVTLRLVAEHADAWHCFPRDAEDLGHLISVLQARCDEIGRDFNDIEISVGVHRENVGGDLSLVESYYDLGVRQYTLGFNGPEWDLSPVPAWIKWRDEKNA